MFRLTALLLALVSSADAFAPITSTPPRPLVILAAEKEPFFLNNNEEEDEISDMEAADQIIMDEGVFAKPPPSFDFDELKEKINVDDLKAKAEELKEKAATFLQDERIQEMSTKATDFAKDVFDQIFTVVGDKLKELKEEKLSTEEILITSQGGDVAEDEGDVTGLDP
mmetsp:Transcript_100/g.213  ORF Transcript_100/g.213 Transcript_100/m.213 type:complete len:168 (-) Transcript_100:357-860(-)|eukprot:CAMPEP_0168733446 /NCGR_PEP_ID=MMETSP0724-20121128/8296_1 /TAXON_ID=265536 /ORGANISM="Amphiprora sp., Strain CCMP467" /LENGTH=167 /DNA_ID=CAMNT_0008780507 /DNA_START=76 /DNA_END=579 /DNA_ORIENTATION=+